MISNFYQCADYDADHVVKESVSAYADLDIVRDVYPLRSINLYRFFLIFIISFFNQRTVPLIDFIPLMISSEYMLRTVVFTCACAEQKLAKSCSPLRYSAACRMASISRGTYTKYEYLRFIGSGWTALYMVYS